MELTEKSYASKGVGGTALGLAIGSLGAQVLGGGLGNLFGGGAHHCDNAGSLAALAMAFGNHGGNGGDATVNRYELGLQKEITNKDMEIAYLKGRDAAKSDALELYRYIDGKFNAVESQIAAQAVVNAQITANISCMQSSIAALQGLTKTVIPITNVCPEPMAKFNSWTAPTAPTTAG